MNKKEASNPLLCDPATGICEIPGARAAATATDLSARQKPVHLLYFTDPICSTCWGIEPQLRKLKREYGDYFDIEYRMGGLLPGWDLYGGSDVRQPADVAPHWDEVSAYYGMPIDGDLWLEDPLPSSFPPSIAFKAAQLQDETHALHFLRRIKEMVFLEKKNITRWEHLQQAAIATGLDPEKLKRDMDGNARQLFNDDLVFARQLGVRGFPSIFFTDANNNRLLVYGYKPYGQYESALLQLYPEAVKQAIDTSYTAVFAHYPRLTTKEFAALTDTSKVEAEKLLNDLHEQSILEKFAIKNGTLWSRPAGRY